VLASLHRTWGPRGLSVFGVSVDKIKTTTRQLITAHQIPYPVVYDHANLGADLLAVRLIPSTYLYDRQHRLVFFRPNIVQSDDPALKAALETAMAP
ncbi:MAG: peroxiredoxin, partial [Bradymonadia bacterium]